MQVSRVTVSRCPSQLVRQRPSNPTQIQRFRFPRSQHHDDDNYDVPPTPSYLCAVATVNHDDNRRHTATDDDEDPATAGCPQQQQKWSQKPIKQRPARPKRKNRVLARRQGLQQNQTKITKALHLVHGDHYVNGITTCAVAVDVGDENVKAPPALNIMSEAPLKNFHQ